MLLRNYKERGVLIMAKFGYVKIVSGQAARRIGRFIGWMKKGLKQKWLLVMILIFYHILIIIFLASIALLTILQNRT